MDSLLTLEVLFKAAAINGFRADDAKLIRNGSHVMWATGGIVGRVGEIGTETTAMREVAISRQLNSCRLRVVRAIDGLRQPTVVDGHPVTWWELLPKHRPATPVELGTVLRRLHAVPVLTELTLPDFAPLASVRERISSNHVLSSAEREWIRTRLDYLDSQYAEAVQHIPVGLIHGDAWQGNVAALDSGELVILDLEAVSNGPRYWDLLSIAIDFTDFARVTSDEYAAFVRAYGGLDVTRIPGYRALADMQELRWVAYVVGRAQHDSAAATEAAHRISCMRGEIPRPWEWKAY